MKNAWKPGSQAKATAGTAFFITHLAVGEDCQLSYSNGDSRTWKCWGPGQLGDETRLDCRRPRSISALERFSSPC
jgi:hypothetical protein